MLQTHLKAGLVLRVMVQRVGEGGHVVADAPAHGDGDLLAARLHARAAARRQRRQRGDDRPHPAHSLRYPHLESMEKLR